MMPATDTINMANTLVQRIARQALVTFRCPLASKSFIEQQSKLNSLMTEIRAADLNISPKSNSEDDHGSGVAPSVCLPYMSPPPVTYMHICETDYMSMGVFLLKSGASIPLHDHPGMHGVLKVIYGKVRISCFDRLQEDAPSHPPSMPQMGALLRRSVLRSQGEFTEESGPCILTPDRDNIHQIDAVDGPTAFMDILAPPYDPDDGRDCHYYQVITEARSGGEESTTTTTTETEKNKEVFLVEISQPPDFWCGSEPYPGPEVCL